MKLSILALNLVLATAALPALASEEYQDGPNWPTTSRTATLDTGSAQVPVFDGQLAGRTPADQIVAPNAASATVQTLNSAPVGEFAPFGQNHSLSR